jgi:hypothetical protein
LPHRIMTDLSGICVHMNNCVRLGRYMILKSKLTSQFVGGRWICQRPLNALTSSFD